MNLLRLGTSLELLGVMSASSFVNTVHGTSAPGRSGVEAAAGLLSRVPTAFHGEMLGLMWEARPAKDAWAYSLCHVWRGNAFRVVNTAGSDRAMLRQWFTFADLPASRVPLVRVMCVDIAALPAEIVLYRGGRGDAAALAQGLSWTPLRPVAGLFAGKWSTWGHAALPPLIVRRVVPREQVAAVWQRHDREIVVLEPGPFEIDAHDPAEIAALGAEGHAMLEAGVLETDALIQAEIAAAAGWRG